MTKRLRPLKAIRAYCIDCGSGSFKEVKLCPIEDCPLWVYRTGRNPQGKKMEKGDISPGEKAAIARPGAS